MGQNAVSLKAFMDLITSADNSVTTLPAIPLPNDEPDDTLKTMQELRAHLDLDSFDPMALRTRQQPEQHSIHAEDLDDVQSEMDMNIEEYNAGGSGTMDMDVDPPANTILQSSLSSSSRVGPMQTTFNLSGSLAIAHNTVVAEKKTGDRCAVCCKAKCRKRWECPGKGNHSKCACPHPTLARGERVRISEETILKYLEEHPAE
ncbi:hypothetical protein B0H14DRAFT_3151123 [Mycena olivaceomarginata]|nr:hypothetical protein B0H14DRAFT_3151123 [Mycena olivaceomarginata]